MHVRVAEARSPAAHAGHACCGSASVPEATRRPALGAYMYAYVYVYANTYVYIYIYILAQRPEVHEMMRFWLALIYHESGYRQFSSPTQSRFAHASFGSNIESNNVKYRHDNA